MFPLVGGFHPYFAKQTADACAQHLSLSLVQDCKLRDPNARCRTTSRCYASPLAGEQAGAVGSPEDWGEWSRLFWLSRNDSKITGLFGLWSQAAVTELQPHQKSGVHFDHPTCGVKSCRWAQQKHIRLAAVAYCKRYSKALEYEYRVKTAALGTLK
jgi:hypothetical protein